MSDAIKATNVSVSVVPTCEKLTGLPTMKWMGFRPSSPVSSFSASSSFFCFDKANDDEDDFSPLPIGTEGAFLGFHLSKQDLSSIDPTPIRESKFDYLVAPPIQSQTLSTLSEPLPPDAFDDLF